VVKNCSLGFLAPELNGPKPQKGQVGLLSKMAQIVSRLSLRKKPTKFAKSFGNYVFKGEGDTFPRKNNQGNTHSPKPYHHT
jgi:hypothetical protein